MDNGASCNGDPLSGCDGKCGDNLDGFYNEYVEGNYRVIETNGIPGGTYM